MIHIFFITPEPNDQLHIHRAHEHGLTDREIQELREILKLQLIYGITVIDGR